MCRTSLKSTHLMRWFWLKHQKKLITQRFTRRTSWRRVIVWQAVLLLLWQISSAACGYGFTLMASRTKDVIKLWGMGLNKDSQLGFQRTQHSRRKMKLSCWYWSRAAAALWRAQQLNTELILLSCSCFALESLFHCYRLFSAEMCSGSKIHHNKKKNPS